MEVTRIFHSTQGKILKHRPVDGLILTGNLGLYVGSLSVGSFFQDLLDCGFTPKLTKGYISDFSAQKHFKYCKSVENFFLWLRRSVCGGGEPGFAVLPAYMMLHTGQTLYNLHTYLIPVNN